MYVFSKKEKFVDSSYLVTHAVNNIWSSPDQDAQHIIELHRITRAVGEFNRVFVYNRNIPLPSTGVKYHVFTSDRIHPDRLKFLSENPDWATERWYNLGVLLNQTSAFINVYNEAGIEVPKYQSWYMFTKEKSIVFAFEENAKIPINYKSEIIYVRAYTNAYYNSLRETSEIDTEYSYKQIGSIGDILSIQNVYDEYMGRIGYTYVYVNGLYIDKINLARVKIGDVVEVIYDSSVRVVSKYRIGDLDTFTSILDNTYKYLLLRNDSRDNTIDYLDDIDIHVVAKTDESGNIYKGVYYHRNNAASIRMVTHRDYSLSVDSVVYHSNNLKDLLSAPALDTLNMYVEIKVRNSGLFRPLVFEDNRIHELYKLDYEARLAAMLGLNALGTWKAEHLEESWYNKLMGTIRLEEFNIDAVERAYGYNAISVLLGNTPMKTQAFSGLQRVIVPQGLANNTTFYEYDADGTMIGYSYQATGSQYVSNKVNTRIVEGIYGQGTTTPSVFFGTTDIPVPTEYNYRVYKANLVNGIEDNNWVDVTGEDIWYTVVSSRLVNQTGGSDVFYMVRTDQKFLTMDLDLSMSGGLYQFDMAELENRHGALSNYLLPVPLGQLDIFLNGKSLIRDLDYYVEFPRVYIVNKEYLVQPATTTVQKVHMRFTGFATKELELDPVEDSGFIEHGFLSNNNRFDIRDDKVMRITVGGSLVAKEDILFSEENSGISVANSSNGKPYQIKDIVVPIKAYNDKDVYVMRTESIAKDKAIEGYLSLKLPQPIRGTPSSIPNRYPVVSLFFSRIVERMRLNEISDVQLNSLTDDTSVLQFFSTYDALIDIDPIRRSLNKEYIVIHPHYSTSPIALSLVKNRVLRRLVGLYGDNMIELSNHVTVAS